MSTLSELLGGSRSAGVPFRQDKSDFAETIGQILGQVSVGQTQTQQKSRLADIFQNPNLTNDPSAMISEMLRANLGPELTKLGTDTVTGMGERRGERAKAEREFFGAQNAKVYEANTKTIDKSRANLEKIDLLKEKNDRGAMGIAGPGTALSWILDGQGFQDRTSFDSIAVELIDRYGTSLGSGGIRNEAEFEKFMKKLPNSGRSKKENEAILEAFTTLENSKLKEAELKQAILSQDPFARNVDRQVQDLMRDEYENVYQTLRRTNDSLQSESEKEAEIMQPSIQVGDVSKYTPGNGNVIVIKPGRDFDGIYEVSSQDGEKLVNEFNYQYFGTSKDLNPGLN